MANPSTGFFRVFHIPDWLSSFNGYSFSGPTFIPVDYEAPDASLDYVDSTTVLINGQPTDNAMLTPFVYNSVTNWGIGVFFDRFPNGPATIQLITVVRQSDFQSDETTYNVFSNNVANITIGNAVTFTNWGDMIFSNAYTFYAQSITSNVNWEIDIYDVNNNLVNSKTGYSSDGNISWTWDLTDSTGVSRLDDNDPFFYPELTITSASTPTNQVPAGSTSVPMPAVASQFPSSGAWLFSYLDNDYSDGTTLYPNGTTTMLNAIHTMEGGPIQYSLGVWEYPIKFGRTYAQSDRDSSWQTLEQNYLQRWTIRNFYYYGHGSPSSIGGDQNEVDTNGYLIGSQNFPGGHAYLTSQWVHDNVTFNKWSGVSPYRFVFLDGCNTAAANGTWPWAWGMPNQQEPLSYYQVAGGARPNAFVGWDVTVGGPGWGTVDGFWEFNEFWMGNWSVQGSFDSLRQAFDDALTGSGWVDDAHYSHLKIFGYQDMKFLDYNHQGDWP